MDFLWFHKPPPFSKKKSVPPNSQGTFVHTYQPHLIICNHDAFLSVSRIREESLRLLVSIFFLPVVVFSRHRKRMWSHTRASSWQPFSVLNV
mmetsp:Transcript_12886/g.32671  ORF Transcript_12886/g.32671 Transcript_12886/m.32671 type:complete len:92 (-) Transcript_12886:378-653(-)